MNTLILDKNLKFSPKQEPSYLSLSFRGNVRVNVAKDISDNLGHDMVNNIRHMSQNIAQYIIGGEHRGK